MFYKILIISGININNLINEVDFSEYKGDKKAEKEAEDKVSEIIMDEIIKLSKTEI